MDSKKFRVVRSVEFESSHHEKVPSRSVKLTMLVKRKLHFISLLQKEPCLANKSTL